MSVYDPVVSLEQDCLGRKTLAEALLRRLADDGCPSILGLFGGWGTGKSSVLNLMTCLNQQKKHSDPESKTHLCLLQIDAWQYEIGGSIVPPVIAYLDECAGGISIDNQDRFRRLTMVLGLMAGDILLATASAGQMRMSTVASVAERAEKHAEKDTITLFREWKRVERSVRGIAQEFHDLVNRVLEAKRCSRLVICIDNLDRCTPDRAVQLIESVRNFLTAPNCVWLFAIDPEVVSKFIDRRYQGAVKGNDYLDKIFSEQYHIPPPSLERDKDNLDRLVNTVIVGRQIAGVRLEWQRYAQIPRVLAPRRLIKTAQKFADFRRVSPFGDPNLIFNLILLYHSWPDFYERLSSDSLQHIQRVLANFGPIPQVEKGDAIPLSPEIKGDTELKHFLRHNFLASITQQTSKIEDIRRALRELRMVGLP